MFSCFSINFSSNFHEICIKRLVRQVQKVPADDMDALLAAAEAAGATAMAEVATFFFSFFFFDLGMLTLKVALRSGMKHHETMVNHDP